MKITLYQRSFAVKDSPVAYSFVPYPVSQRHTFKVGETVFEADHKELQVSVPEESKLDFLKNLLSWTSDKGLMKSTANEVFNFAQTQVSGFRLVK